MNEARPIPGFEGKYWIDPEGQVYNELNHRLKPVISKGGIQQVELRKDGQRELIDVEVLVAITWRNQ